MTREEAINNLKLISASFIHPATKEQIKIIADTCDMAIKALEQEPCEDVVSRKQAIDKWNELSVRGRTEFDQVLMTLPPVKLGKGGSMEENQAIYRAEARL